ncbi:hypothetical protein FHS98_003646 [Sphingomonas oligoaromativorans]|jgi:hypothetical protein|nr:hypothetical protein [Sphingomonas oligoaromativorans]
MIEIETAPFRHPPRNPIAIAPIATTDASPIRVEML